MFYKFYIEKWLFRLLWDKLCAFINSKCLAKEFCTNGILKIALYLNPPITYVWSKLKICNQSKYLKCNGFHISTSYVAQVGLRTQVTYC